MKVLFASSGASILGAAFCVFQLQQGATCSAHPNDRMSRHLLLEGASDANVIMVAEAETTEGPFDEEESDYMTTPDMTVAALPGSPGIDQDVGRLSVLDGIPLDLTFTLYNVDLDADVGREIDGAQVYVWQCDTMGIYSAVEHRMQTENTEGQKWLRSKATTASDGTVAFRTILPGWYAGRPIHYHFRIRLPGENSFAATSQLFISDGDLALYQDVPVYAENNMRITSLSDDRIFRSLDAGVGEALTLGLSGSNEGGYSSSIKIGLSYDAPDEAPAEVEPAEEEDEGVTVSFSDEGFFTFDTPSTMTNNRTNVTTMTNMTNFTDNGGELLNATYGGDIGVEVSIAKSPTDDINQKSEVAAVSGGGRRAFRMLPMAMLGLCGLTMS